MKRNVNINIVLTNLKKVLLYISTKLQGGVQVPTGGKVCEPFLVDWVKFPNRRYSPDERRFLVFMIFSYFTKPFIIRPESFGAIIFLKGVVLNENKIHKQTKSPKAHNGRCSCGTFISANGYNPLSDFSICTIL